MAIVVNGNTMSYGHIAASLGGVPRKCFTEIAYGDSMEETREAGMGIASVPDRRSAGVYSCDPATLTGFFADMQAFLDDLAKLGGGSYSVVEFPIVLTFAAITTAPISVHELVRCRVLAVGNSYSAGADLLKQAITIQPIYIVRNGATAFDRSQGFII